MLRWIDHVKPESHQVVAVEWQQWMPPSTCPVTASGPHGIALLKQMNTARVHGMWPLVQQMHSFPSLLGRAETIHVHLGWIAVHV